MIFAVCGICSQICKSPAVEIGRKGPPVAEPGFKSQISMVLGPPPIQSMMQLLRRLVNSAALALIDWPIINAGAAIAEAPAM